MGDLIRRERLKAGLSVRALGALINPERPENGRRSIYKWEKGEVQPRPETLDQIADVLGIPRERFL